MLRSIKATDTETLGSFWQFIQLQCRYLHRDILMILIKNGALYLSDSLQMCRLIQRLQQKRVITKPETQRHNSQMTRLSDLARGSRATLSKRTKIGLILAGGIKNHDTD